MVLIDLIGKPHKFTLPNGKDLKVPPHGKVSIKESDYTSTIKSEVKMGLMAVETDEGLQLHSRVDKQPEPESISATESVGVSVKTTKPTGSKSNKHKSDKN